MFELRRTYPTLNDGYQLEALSSQTQDTYLKGSGDVPSPFGIWSIYRSALDGVQDLSDSGQGNQGVWLVYSNENTTKDYDFDCQDESMALVSPFAANITVKNLFYPFDEYTLENSTQTTGCLSGLSMQAYGFKAFVPVDQFVAPDPVITSVVPSHDSRIPADVALGQQQNISIEIYFSTSMDCTSVANSLTIDSHTQDGITAEVLAGTTSCGSVELNESSSSYAGQPAALWKFSAELGNVSHGIHTFSVNNASSGNGSFTNSVDRFLFRIGDAFNPIVFPAANYSSNLLHRNEDTGRMYITPAAPGADKFRYSTTWGSTWSSWLNYTGDNTTLEDQDWSGTSAQEWQGEQYVTFHIQTRFLSTHGFTSQSDVSNSILNILCPHIILGQVFANNLNSVVLQFWSQAAASAEHFQHADLKEATQRRWPHAFVLGEWNEWGYDDGLTSSMELTSNGTWELNLATEWPTQTTINVWGMNPDGSPDKTMQYGDADGDQVLDWLHPDSLETNVINITSGPGWPHSTWRIVVNDATYGYSLRAVGSAWHHLLVAAMLAVLPIVTAMCSIWAFKSSFYEVKVNLVGIAAAAGFPSVAFLAALFNRKKAQSVVAASAASPEAAGRKVLIATMEYEIEDWEIKIKIGGLGVMASLMGKALGHQSLIWVVPCVGGIDYPVDTPAEPMIVTVNGCQYEISVQYHYLRNITFVLLDSPIFRLQSKGVPYPARMDDLDSAV